MKKEKTSTGFIPSKTQHLLPTLEDLNKETQRISLGFYPNRAILPDPSLTPEERIDMARVLAALYQKIGEPIPNALLIII